MQAIKVKLLVGLFLISSILAIGQKSFSWGRISDDDLKIKSCEFEPNAEAMVLDEKCDIYFQTYNGIQYYYEVHTRIKIFTEAGYKFGEVYIPYRFKSESVDNIEANVIDPSGSITKLKSDNIFKDKVTDRYYQIKFTLPNLKPQCIIEYKYRLQSSNFISIREWEFQKNLPVRHSMLEFKRPEGLNYKFIMQNASLIKYTEEKYEATNLKSVQEVPFQIRAKDFSAMVKFQLTGYLDNYGVMKPYNSDVPKIIEGLRDNYNFGKKIFDKGASKELWKKLEPIINVLPNEHTKALEIYKNISNLLSWNKKYGLYLDNIGDKVIKTSTANSSELNGTIINLFRMAGLESYPVLTNPRSFGYLNKGVLDLENINHIIGYAKLDSIEYYFDATDKDLPFGLLPEEDNVDEALLMKEDSQEWVTIPAMKDSDYYTFNLHINEDNELVGNLITKSLGISMAEEMGQNTKDSIGSRWVKRLEKNGAKCIVNNFAQISSNLKTNEIRFKMDIKLADVLNDGSEIIYIPTNLYSRFSENPFKETSRSSPIEFGKTIQETLISTIIIPKTYTLESLPKNITMTIPSSGIIFSIKYVVLSDKVIFSRSLNINKTFMLENEYQDVKQLFEEYLDRLNDMIVLKKH